MRSAVAALMVGLFLAACGPGGPGCHELAATAVYAGAMPASTPAGAVCSDPRSGIEGSTYGYAMRVYGTDVDPASVLAWHRARYESDGWTATTDRPVSLHDGYAPSDAWRKGDLVAGLGVLRRDSVGSDPTAGVPGATVYEVFIAYDPPR